LVLRERRDDLLKKASSLKTFIALNNKFQSVSLDINIYCFSLKTGSALIFLSFEMHTFSNLLSKRISMLTNELIGPK